MIARFVTPGSTTALRLGRSISTIARIFEVTISTPSVRGSAPPERPVPEPLATNGTPYSLHSLITPATCSAFSGRTATPGVARW
ncbi:hypothetical protein GCM10020219_023040 [Nonomuraea dietziae]